MTVHIIALVFVLFAIGCARLLLLHSFSLGVRGIYAWAATALALFGLAGEQVAVLLAGLLILLLATPSNNTARVAFFLIMIPSLPVNLDWLISLPGIKAFFDVTWAKLCVLCLLLPCLSGSYAGTNRLTVPDAALIAYAILTALVVASVQNTTSGLRFFIDQLLLIVVPYLAVRRSIQTSKDLETVMNGFVLAAVVLSCVAVAATAKQWDFYRLYEQASIISMPDFRGGVMRISLTASTHSLGFHCVAAILMIEALRLREPFQFRSARVLQLLLLLCIYATQSRGAMGSLAVGLGVMTLIRMQNAVLRRSLWCLSMLAGVFAVHLVLSADFAKNDPYGTFKYRQELLETSFQFIIDNPWLGDFDFYHRPEFQHLIQGQGIIDITNLYLLLPLHYGVPIALLLLGTIGASLPRIIFGRRSARNRTSAPAMRKSAFGRGALQSLGASPAAEQGPPQQDGLAMKAAIAGSIAGWFFLVATTSDAGLVMHLGLTLAAIGAAMLRPGFAWTSDVQSVARVAPAERPSVAAPAGMIPGS